MTAEERMAYFQGEMKRSPVYGAENKRKNIDLIFLKIKFMIAVLLFIVFLSLDYTGYEIRGVGSEDIIKKVTTDFELPKEINLKKINKEATEIFFHYFPIIFLG